MVENSLLDDDDKALTNVYGLFVCCLFWGANHVYLGTLYVWENDIVLLKALFYVNLMSKYSRAYLFESKLL